MLSSCLTSSYLLYFRLTFVLPSEQLPTLSSSSQPQPPTSSPIFSTAAWTNPSSLLPKGSPGLFCHLCYPRLICHLPLAYLPHVFLLSSPLAWVSSTFYLSVVGYYLVVWLLWFRLCLVDPFNIIYEFVCCSIQNYSNPFNTCFQFFYINRFQFEINIGLIIKRCKNILFVILFLISIGFCSYLLYR